jgi:hypothetical protein
VCRYAPQQLSTFALNLYRYRTKRGDRSVLIDFWDTAGQERFNSMHRCRNYYIETCPPILLGHSRIGEIQQYAQVQILLYRDLSSYISGTQQDRRDSTECTGADITI